MTGTRLRDSNALPFVCEVPRSPCAAAGTAGRWLLLLACLALTACAGPGGFGGAADRPAFANPNLGLQAARDAIVPGQSSRADVAALLGKATVISFGSGYEVWAYRGRFAQVAMPGAEFIVLFDPSGRVKKTRIRPPVVPS